MHLVSPVCLRQESKSWNRPQIPGAIVQKTIISSTTKIATSDVEASALWLEPGKNLHIPDTLSRAPEGKSETVANWKDEFEVIIIENLPVSGEKLEQFKEETRKDLTLQKLKTTVLNGYPESKSQIDPELHNIREYWNVKEEIIVCDDLLLRNDNLIVPNALRGWCFVEFTAAI